MWCSNLAPLATVNRVFLLLVIAMAECNTCGPGLITPGVGCQELTSDKPEFYRTNIVSNNLTDNRTCPSEAYTLPKMVLNITTIRATQYHSRRISSRKDVLYLARLEEEKRIEAERKKEEQEDKEKIKNKVKSIKHRKVLEKKSQEAKEAMQKENLLEKQESEAKEVQSYKSLVAEANERINNAIKINDQKDLQIAQTTLEAPSRKLEETDSAFEKIRNKQHQTKHHYYYYFGFTIVISKFRYPVLLETAAFPEVVGVVAFADDLLIGVEASLGGT
uniref:(California timema) hypothetical protein n=1 Tax=Timema californicum TaxID=61474 RepID=A0A7R9P6T9_TIMCA|nr:unnamed protein product [Timema californicum]